jgi:sensor histidine kinase YesM
VFITVIQWVQRRQLNKQFEIERTISKLRFRAIKNEISPHFTLNVLNSIVALAYKGEPEKVFEHSMKFSKLIQASLLDSEKMDRTLEEEVEFVKNYLELQKLRFGDKIRYQYKIDENVDLSMIVPKMVIHTYTENAIKHGLATLEKDGLLKIIIHQTNHYLIITIDDNGVGRGQSLKTKSSSTGKGQKIMQEYYRIFNARNEQKITCEIIDKKDDLKKSAGTRVVVKIPEGYRYVL